MVVDHRVVDLRLPLWVVRQLLELELDLPLEFIETELGDQELHARLGAILLLAQPRKNTRYRLRQRHQVFRGKEIAIELGLERQRAQAAADKHLEALDLLAAAVLHLRNGSNVMHAGQAAGVIPAAREGDLELTAEILGVGVP